MRLRLPPITAYPHEIEYVFKTGEDDWGKPTLSDPVLIEHARVDEGYNFSRSGTNSTNDMPNALVSMFEKYNDYLPDFENEQTIVFNGREFTIVKVIPLYFMSNEIIGYELEVK